ncbi:Delta(24)-sterol C-methyltransferase [Ramicandelaber brevisporus]|nr:Delta(24)-sterol C-methyltransferase [Ramicandelaber brevisporus]
MSSALTRTAALLPAVASKDTETHSKEVNSYIRLWNPKTTANTSNDDDEGVEEDSAERKKEYATLATSYYNLVTDFYNYGWGYSYHFARKYKDEPFHQSIARHEHFLASLGQFKPGQSVLDVGCGVGGPAREIARFAGCNITGLNINDYQLGLAKKYSEQTGTAPLTTFVKGDFLQMPFADESFDGAYAIEATCHAPKLTDVYSEIFRVLKPGSACSLFEWCSTDKYDPENAEHRRVARDIEFGSGLPKLFTTTECLAALKEVGFEVEYSQDLAESHIGGDVPWYADLQPSSKIVIRGFSRSPIGIRLTAMVVRALEFVRIAPRGSYEVQKVLLTAADSLAEGGKLGIFTPMFTVLCRKPNRS